MVFCYCCLATFNVVIQRLMYIHAVSTQVETFWEHLLPMDQLWYANYYSKKYSTFCKFFYFQAFEMQTGSTVYKLVSPSSEKLPATSIRFRPQSTEEASLQNVALIACKPKLN